jgi:catechol 2,3-dioxygenase-like lactoylglutathione lyase family enzyme
VLIAMTGSAGRLIGAGAEATSDTVPEPGAGSTFSAVELNHIALRVTDVGRARDFYMKHLGLKLSREGTNNAFLTCGRNFVALFRGDRAGLDHYCYSVKGYDADAAEQTLRQAGLSDIRRSGDRIYFSDSDGLTVQLAAEEHLPD